MNDVRNDTQEDPPKDSNVYDRVDVNVTLIFLR
jgi:hypothetical protein